MNHVASNVYVNEIKVEVKSDLKLNLENFFEIESLGTHCVPKCGECKCGSCTLGDQNYSIQEERELAMINEGLKYNENERCWIVKYPWIREPKDLPNNVSVAIARMKSTEKRLGTLGTEYSKVYNDQIQDMVERKVAKKLSIEEMNTYDGPVHYIHHHEILKPDSATTPVRIVFNSSANYMGHKLNDYWAKGPDVLNNLVGVLIRFRQERIAIVGDISKMYNSVLLGTLEQHTHRFVWRDLDVGKMPDHYVLTAVAFGDRPSGIIAMTALRKTAERHKDEYPEEGCSRQEFVCGRHRT